MEVGGKEYWESDEFEDLVARSLIGLYETNIKKSKKVPKCIRFNEDVFKRFKNLGCYFAPHDREMMVTSADGTVTEEDDYGKAAFTQEIDILNDGVPDRAVMTMVPTNQERDGYLNAIYMEKVPFLPKPFLSELKGKYYRFMQLFFYNERVEGYGMMLVVSREGKIQSCYLHDCYTDPLTNRNIPYKNRPVMSNNTGTYEDYHSIWGNFTIQFYQDRRYLWNVQAIEGPAKATFGVYPEQIKSLFYARSLPATGTGRKRPILHWVQAHQRRMKSGTEVDVDKFLRGTHEFEMNGTKFKITNPLKPARLRGG